MMTNIEEKKFKAVFNPIGWGPNGQFTIKVDDDIELPIAIVLIGVGGVPDAKSVAKGHADRIVKCLNYCKGKKL